MNRLNASYPYGPASYSFIHLFSKELYTYMYRQTVILCPVSKGDLSLNRKWPSLIRKMSLTWASLGDVTSYAQHIDL